MRKIALEEHFDGAGFRRYLTGVSDLFDPAVLAAWERQLPEFADERISTMDAAGIEIAVLSQTAPGIQTETDVQDAITFTKRNNDFLAQQISLRPDRFRAFACVALQDPAAAATELRRCVNELGFVGTLVNGSTLGHYLDEEQYTPFWEALAALDVPLYLHPGLLPDCPSMFAGHPELAGPVWGWSCDTAAHALRLIFSGIFERYPNITVILGHGGEALPFDLWRLDSRALTTLTGRALPRLPSEYVRKNMMVTMSGVFDVVPLRCCIDALGADRVMFSTDYPYEDVIVGGRWIEAAPISDEERRQICWSNAARILKIA